MRSLRWLQVITEHFKLKPIICAYVVIYGMLSTSPVSAFFLPRSTFQIALSHISNYWLGIFFYIIVFVSLFHIIKIILIYTRVLNSDVLKSRRVFIATGLVLALLVSSFSAYGIIHAKNVLTKSYSVTVNKDLASQKSLRIALVADFHLGYSIGLHHMRSMVEKINAQDIDIICIAGDIFDNDYDSIKNPDEIIEVLKSMKSKYGVYACYGNHDVDEKILGGFTFNQNKLKSRDPRMESFLNRAGVITLMDESILVNDEFYLIGRLDKRKPANETKTRLTPIEIMEGIDTSKLVIMLDHEPFNLKELSNLGVDIDLSGHTHNGQMFPGTLLMPLIWQNPYGLEKVGNMYSIVTSGIGAQGPNMRVGSNSEVVIIDVLTSSVKS